MQTSYGFSGLLCFSKTNTNSHSHSAPALYLTTRAEARVGGNSCRQSFRATRTSSWMLTGIVKCFKAHPMPTQCSCLSMHKTVKVCEKLSSRKSFLKEVRNSTVARESLRASKRSPTFRLQSTCSVARPKVRVRPPLTAGATPGAQHQELPAHWLAKKWQAPSFELSTATKGYSHRCGHRHL